MEVGIYSQGTRRESVTRRFLGLKQGLVGPLLKVSWDAKAKVGGGRAVKR